jgi:hypothetical protein
MSGITAEKLFEASDRAADANNKPAMTSSRRRGPRWLTASSPLTWTMDLGRTPTRSRRYGVGRDA